LSDLRQVFEVFCSGIPSAGQNSWYKQWNEQMQFNLVVIRLTFPIVSLIFALWNFKPESMHAAEIQTHNTYSPTKLMTIKLHILPKPTRRL
jgi:hypothetical protein